MSGCGRKRGAIIGIEAYTRVDDDEIAAKLGAAAERINKFPGLEQLSALAGGRAENNRARRELRNRKEAVDSSYLSLPKTKQRGEVVEKIMSDELHRLETGNPAKAIKTTPPIVATPAHRIRVPKAYVDTVREFRDRGEEEQRQLVVRLFVEVLGYRRPRIHSEHKHNDVRVHDCRNKPCSS